MPLGNDSNAELFAGDLMQLGQEAIRDSAEILKTIQSIEYLQGQGVVFTPEQVSGALNSIDVADIQTLFNTAKATYLNANAIGE